MSVPRLSCDDPVAVHLYDQAIDCVRRNTVGGDAGYLRAGGGYEDAWTRDAAINSWSGVSLTDPGLAERTLRCVTDVIDGQPVLQQDDQWWDHIIWVIGAHQHYLVTGDVPFLAWAFDVGRNSLALLDSRCYDADAGLYRGPAVMQDGISGYPSPPRDDANPSSFVLDHPASHDIMCLSTNATYAGALRSLAAMARALGHDPASFEKRAAAVTQAIDAHLWLEDERRYAFFVGPDATVDRSQEGFGQALMLLLRIASDERARDVLAHTHLEPFGLVNLWPHLPPHSPEKPARHGGICWPMVMGMWGDAVARRGATADFQAALAHLMHLHRDGSYFEIYDARTGTPTGGWQSGWEWDSQPDQTWSATAYLRLIHHGVAGLRFGHDGFTLQPMVPNGWGTVRLEGLRYRGRTLDVIVGEGVEPTFELAD